MGNNTKKKVRSLPPLGKDSKSKGKKKSEVSDNCPQTSYLNFYVFDFQFTSNFFIDVVFQGGLDVQIPDRQRLIGSPAPQSMRRQNKIKAFKKVNRKYFESKIFE